MRSHVFVAAICLCLFHSGLRIFAQESNPIPFATSKIELGTVGLAGDGFAITTLDSEYQTVTMTYTVEVPYQETVNGKTEMRTRTETRTRDVSKKRHFPTVTEVPTGVVAFSSAAGKRIADLSVVKKALASPRAAVITYSLEPLEDFYRQMLKPGTVVIHIDQSKLPPAPMPIADDTRIQPAGLPPAPVVDPAADF